VGRRNAGESGEDSRVLQRCRGTVVAGGGDRGAEELMGWGGGWGGRVGGG